MSAKAWCIGALFVVLAMAITQNWIAALTALCWATSEWQRYRAGEIASEPEEAQSGTAKLHICSCCGRKRAPDELNFFCCNTLKEVTGTPLGSLQNPVRDIQGTVFVDAVEGKHCENCMCVELDWLFGRKMAALLNARPWRERESFFNGLHEEASFCWSCFMDGRGCPCKNDE